MTMILQVVLDPILPQSDRVLNIPLVLHFQSRFVLAFVFARAHTYLCVRVCMCMSKLGGIATYTRSRCAARQICKTIGRVRDLQWKSKDTDSAVHD